MSTLPDIQNVLSECENKLSSVDVKANLIITDDLWDTIVASYNIVSPTDTVQVIGGHTLRIDTPTEKAVFISCLEMAQGWAIIPYYNALKSYEDVINQLAAASAISRSDPTNIWKDLPRIDWELHSNHTQVQALKTAINTILSDQTDKDLIHKFLSDEKWSGVSKKLNRKDWISSAVPIAGKWLAMGAERRGNLVAALSINPQIEDSLKSVIDHANSNIIVSATHATTSTINTPGVNKLYYGAPGTGKSYQIDQDTRGSDTVRTVFHPDTQNSDFIGTLKPVNDSGTLSYRFSPGPFSRALVKAIQKPDEHIYLIIEELNRAPAAAVFGELFLLLDREPNGRSSYDIDFPSEEFEKWFNDKIKPTKMDKLSLPANLSILASMNSADQGVFPLDTAFRRRWLSTYMPVTESKASAGSINIQTGNTQAVYEWKIFLKYLNEFLIKELQIEEDRLIGQKFLTNCELENGTLSGKLLIYLWDDLLRHHKREILFSTLHQTYGSLHRANENSEQIFSTDFLDGLGKLSQITGTEPDEENGIEASNS